MDQTTEEAQVAEWDKNAEDWEGETIKLDTEPEHNKKLSYYMDQAIYNNHLEIFAITSQASGRTKGEGFSSGEGKTHFAMGLEKAVYQAEAFEEMHRQTLDEKIMEAEAEERVKQAMGYDRMFIYDTLDRGFSKRVRCALSDDGQLYMGKQYSHDPELMALSHLVEPARPNLALWLITCPHIGSLATCIRDIIQFEIKIPYRGIAEVQRINRVTRYENPLDPRAKLDYFHDTYFTPVSDSLAAWYEVWRASHYREHVTAQRTAYMRKHGLIKEDQDPKSDKEDPTDEARAAGARLARLRWAKDKAPIENVTIEIN